MNLFNFFKNLRLGVKLNAVVILSLGLLLTVIVVVASRSTQSLALQSGQQGVKQETKVVQERFDEAERALLADAKLLVNTPGLVEAVTGEDTEGARTAILIGSAPLNVDDVDIVDADGMLLAGTGDSEQRTTEQERALLRLALIGSEATGAIIEEEGKLEFRIAAVVPLRDRSGQLVGGLLVSRRVDDEFMKEINLSRTDKVYLAFIHAGQILALDFPELEEPEDFSAHLLEETAIERALGGQIVIAEELVLSKEGVSYALAHIPLTVGGDTHAAIGILVNYRELSSFQRDLTRSTVIIFSVAALVVLGVIVLFSWRSIAIPIGKLRSVTQQMAAGDYAQRAETTTRDEVGQLGQAFNEMADQLQQTLEGLEQRVADRTRALETSTQVSRRLSTILDREQLVAEVVKQVQGAFDYYHAHIYLIDAATQDLVMTGGTGEAGRVMLASGHRIPWGKGLTGRAAATNSIVLVPDVSQEEGWLPNPLLPETRSEVAVPITAGERVLGVLDVQHDVGGGLDENDADLLQSIAGQVAIALQNASMFTEAQQRAEHQALVNLITQRIQSTTTVEDALQIAVRELGRAIEAQETSVQLV